ncbi:GNAT family N-acetyltransferase [Virgibacillus necropolis]|uniref:GNAT family N-acetyltransferase n=1 Tax=Virgibacillus necropolis TaxID=163877 RepID=UPI0038511D86
MLIFSTEEFFSYKVRQAIKEDTPSVVKMLTNAASWLKENGVDQWSYLHSGKENNEIEAAIIKGTTYVLEDDEGKFIASFNLSPEQNDWDLELWGNTNDQALYVHRLVVARGQHKKDIGKKLLAWMIKNIDQKIESIRLDCIGHNRVLNLFYQDAGFTYVGSHDMGGELFSKYERPLRL